MEFSEVTDRDKIKLIFYSREKKKFRKNVYIQLLCVYSSPYRLNRNISICERVSESRKLSAKTLSCGIEINDYHLLCVSL